MYFLLYVFVYNYVSVYMHMQQEMWGIVFLSAGNKFDLETGLRWRSLTVAIVLYYVGIIYEYFMHAKYKCNFF